MAIGLGMLFNIRLPLNFALALQVALDSGFLASLAHHAVELAAQLSLYPARRQSGAERPAPMST